MFNSSTHAASFSSPAVCSDLVVSELLYTHEAEVSELAEKPQKPKLVPWTGGQLTVIDARMLHITVETWVGADIRYVKEQIAVKDGIPVEWQSLSGPHGPLMDDDCKLSDCLFKGETLRVSWRSTAAAIKIKV
jgi:hypothetical protein